jgi:hypothetical protein
MTQRQSIPVELKNSGTGGRQSGFSVNRRKALYPGYVRN